jgi:hypothetical protein
MKKTTISKQRFVLLLLCHFIATCGMAQSENIASNKDTPDKSPSKKWITFSGNANFTYEFYHVDTTKSSGFRARKPPHLARLVFAPVITIKEKLSLPFELMLSSQATNFTTPVEQYKQQFNHWYGIWGQIKTRQDLFNYVTNPINRLGVSPTYKNQKLYLGTHNPNYSEFTQGNVSLFGIGTELNFKKFFIRYNQGIAQHSILPDEAANIKGSFLRGVKSLRMGFDFKKKHLLAFNLVVAEDKINSLPSVYKTLKPTDGAVGSLEWKVGFGNKLSWENELAVSKITHNTNFFNDKNVLSDTILAQIKSKFDETLNRNVPSYIKHLGVFNPSTSVDFALRTGLNFNAKNVGLGIKSTYVGPGFRPVGYPFFVSDRFEATLSPRLTILNGKINFTGTFGKRINAVATKLERDNIKIPKIKLDGYEFSTVPDGYKAAPTVQDLISANLNTQVNDNLSFDLTYSNFGIDNTVLNDTFRVRNIAQSFAFMPVYILPLGESWVANLALMASLDKFKDYNIVSGALNDNDSKIYNASFQMTGKKNPLTLGLSLGHNNLVSSQYLVKNNSATLTTGYKFFKKKLSTTLNVTLLRNKNDEQNSTLNNQSKDVNLIGQLSVRYKHPKSKINLQWNIGNTQFYRNIYGASASSTALKEITSTLTLNKSF